jgi:hypothetical protein
MVLSAHRRSSDPFRPMDVTCRYTILTAAVCSVVGGTALALAISKTDDPCWNGERGLRTWLLVGGVEQCVVALGFSLVLLGESAAARSRGTTALLVHSLFSLTLAGVGFLLLTQLHNNTCMDRVSFFSVFVLCLIGVYPCVAHTLFLYWICAQRATELQQELHATAATV